MMFGQGQGTIDLDYSSTIIYSFGPKMEKSKFQVLCVNDTVPRPGNDINLVYPHTFIYSISFMHLPSFRSQAATAPEKSIVFTFSL